MFRKISFCVGNKKIEVNGQAFSIGELTAECLNISVDDYTVMREVARQVAKNMKMFEVNDDIANWFMANEYLIQLDEMLRRYHIFRLLRDDVGTLSEAREFTQQYSLFGDSDCVVTEHDFDVVGEIGLYYDYLNNPSAYGGEDQPPIPPEPPAKTRAGLICLGDRKGKWKFYRDFADRYLVILSDIASFNDTIQNFIRISLSKLDKMNASQYVAALYGFLNDDRADKWIANPHRGSGYYFGTDTVEMRHIPRETAPGSGEYRIYEYYEVELLQALLKMDFYKALDAGYTIRKCAYCGRYFLLKDARHTKYCDQPSSGNPKYTCAQLGYHFKGIKETAGDNPRSQSLRRCLQRIDRDTSRGIITADNKTVLYRKAKDLFHTAETETGTSYEAFEQMLQSENLYPLCGVVRKSRPRGRPRRGCTYDQ